MIDGWNVLETLAPAIYTFGRVLVQVKLPNIIVLRVRPAFMERIVERQREDLSYSSGLDVRVRNQGR